MIDLESRFWHEQEDRADEISRSSATSIIYAFYVLHRGRYQGVGIIAPPFFYIILFIYECHVLAN